MTTVEAEKQQSLFVSYRQRPPLANTYDSIVIGSGIGGLTAASLLAKYGLHKVLVIERHGTAGGFTHVFRRPGFEWDVGLHYVGQMGEGGASRVIFDNLTEGRLQWEPMPDIYDRIFLGERQYDFPAGRERWRAQMHRYFPGETRAIDRYLRAVEKCARVSGLYFAEKILPGFLSKAIGGLLRWPFLAYARRTTAETIRRFTPNAELLGVLSAQWGDYGLPPGQSSFGLHAVIAQHYLDGGSYPVGGAGRIAEALAPGVLEAGGLIVTNAEVSEVRMNGDRAIGVRLADGRELRAGFVISDAGAPNTFRRLLPEGTPGIERVLDGIGRLQPSSAHICLYMGLDRGADELGLTGTNLWVCPSEDHDGNSRRSAEDPEAPLPSVYISFPSAKDPEFEGRHPGHATIEAISMVPYAWFRRWEGTPWKKHGPDYERFKQALADRLLEAVYRHVPSVRNHVVHAELSTPLSTRHFMNYSAGEIYGLAGTPDRFALRDLGPKTPVENLFLAGQDAGTLGVMGAAAGGILAASSVLRRNLFSSLTRSAEPRGLRRPRRESDRNSTRGIDSASGHCPPERRA